MALSPEQERRGLTFVKDEEEEKEKEKDRDIRMETDSKDDPVRPCNLLFVYHLYLLRHESAFLSRAFAGFVIL